MESNRRVTTDVEAVVIRRLEATPRDAELLSSLGARLFEESFGGDNEPEDVRLFLSNTYTPALQLAELRDANRAVWVAGSDGRHVGYAMLRRGSESQAVRASAPAEVQRIYAHRSMHGRGVGARLLQACLQQALAWGCDVVWLGVWERNPRGIAFYEKHGFRRVGEQRFLVGTDSQRDYVMAVRLHDAPPFSKDR